MQYYPTYQVYKELAASWTDDELIGQLAQHERSRINAQAQGEHETTDVFEDATRAIEDEIMRRDSQREEEHLPLEEQWRMTPDGHYPAQDRADGTEAFTIFTG